MLKWRSNHKLRIKKLAQNELVYGFNNLSTWNDDSYV